MNRRDFAGHVAWTGAGIAYALSGGVFAGTALAQAQTIEFVQISDSHIGFHQAANPDVSATLKAAIDAINALPLQPAFVVHTGDVTHLSTPEQFETAKGLLSTLRAPLVVLPGEHDFLASDKRRFFDVFPSEQRGGMWRSWDRGGVHYVVLINVFDFEKMGLLGSEQLAWLQRDLQSQKRSTPIVVFTHVPLYALYPQWDMANVLASLGAPQRQVLELAYYQGLTHEEIARRLDEPVGTVKSRLSNTLRALRRALSGGEQ